MDDQEKTREQCIEELQQAQAEIARLRQELSQARSQSKADDPDTLGQERLLLRTVINSLPDFIYVKDTASRFTVANESVAGLMSATPEDLIGKSDFDFFPQELASEYYNDEQQVIQTNQAMIGKEERTLRNGQERWIVTSKVPLHDASGKVVGIVGTGQDVTGRKQFEEQLARDRSSLAEAMEAAAMANWEFDVASGTFTFNALYYQFLGTSLEQEGSYEMPAPVFAQRFVHPDDAIEVGLHIQKALTTADPNYKEEFEARLRLSDGSYMNALVTLRIEKDSQGNTVRFYGTNQNITERKRNQEMIARRAAELATVAEVSTIISTILSPDEMLQQVVDLTKERFNLYHAHIYLLNETGSSLVLTQGAGEVGRQMVAEKRTIAIDAEKSLVARTARTRRGVLVNDVWQDPEFLPHPLLPETRSEMAVPLIIGDRLIGVLDVQDDEIGRFSEENLNVLTTLGAQIAVALQNARQYARLQASESLVRTVIDATPDWIFIKDREHRFRLVNNAYAQSLHLRQQDIIGKNDLELGFPEEQVKGNPEKGIPGFWAEDKEVMESSKPKFIDNELVTVDGKVRILSTYKTALHDQTGQVWGVLGFARDVTEREEMLQDMDRQRRTLEKIAQMQYNLSLTTHEEEILSTVAHALNLGEGQGLLLNYIEEDAPGVPGLFQTRASWRDGRLASDDPALKSRMYVKDTPLSRIWAESPDHVHFISDWRNDPALDETSRVMVEASGIVAMALVPLFIGGHWQGTLSISWNTVHAFSEEEKFVIQQLREPVASTVARRRAALAESEALAETEALYEGSRQLARSRSYEEVLDVLVRNSVLKNYDTASIMLFNRPWKDTPPETGHVIASWERVAGTLSLKRGMVMPIAAMADINPLKLSSSIMISDLQDTERVDADLRAYFLNLNSKFRAVITYQMVIGGEWIGTLNVASLQPMYVIETEVRYMRSLVEQAATVIQNLSLFEQIQHTLEETANLYVASRRMSEATSMKEMLEAVMEGMHISDINRAVLVLSELDETGAVNAMIVAATWYSGSGTRPVPVGMRFGRAIYKAVALFQEEEAVFYEDAQNDPRLDPATVAILKQSNVTSIAFLPLWVGGRQIGALLLESEILHRFSEDEVRSYPALISQLAVVVENRRLLEVAEGRARREQTISDISSRVRNSMDAGIVLRTAVRDLSTALGRPVFIRLGSSEQLIGSDEEAKRPEDGQQREGGK